MVMEDMIMALATAMVIVILVATTTIITVMGILLDINNLAVTGMTIITGNEIME
jgi:Na+-transporting NADH:ubiquinone oxidoreductase subunit NqrF